MVMNIAGSGDSLIETLKCIGAEVERLARTKGFRVEVSEDAALRLVERRSDPLPARKRHESTERSRARGWWVANADEIATWFERQRFNILTDDYPRSRGNES